MGPTAQPKVSDHGAPETATGRGGGYPLLNPKHLGGCPLEVSGALFVLNSPVSKLPNNWPTCRQANQATNFLQQFLCQLPTPPPRRNVPRWFAVFRPTSAGRPRARSSRTSIYWPSGIPTPTKTIWRLKGNHGSFCSSSNFLS